MSSLTPKAQELVQAGRVALRPSAADRERVSLALAPHLGAALAGGGASAAALSSAAAKATVGKVLVGLVGVGVAGGALVLALRSGKPAGSPAAVPAEPTTTLATNALPVASPPLPSAPPTDERGAAEATRTAASAAPGNQATSRSPDASAGKDSLAQEVAILSRASAELHGGQPAAALAVLAEHQRRFPRGVLTQERTAARVRALCALGRTTEAQAELARLAPDSPLEARARKACGLARAKKE